MVEGKVVWGAVEDSEDSVLGKVGSVVAPVFKPLGFGEWQPTVATVMGLVAKEEVVSVFGVLYGTDTGSADAAALSPVADAFDEMSGGYGRFAAFAFMLFNLLCAPCFAAIGAIKREMNSAKWTWFAIAYQCGFAYTIALIVYQLGRLYAGAAFGVGSAAAVALLAGLVYMLIRRNKYDAVSKA